MPDKHETVEQFLARGGKIQEIPADQSTIEFTLMKCKCGCQGNRIKHEKKRNAEISHKK